MATLPNNKFFNISDTNFLGVGFGASDSVGRDIDSLSRSNAEMFAMYGNQAIAMAQQRSSNYQKFGNLFKEAATAKNAIEQWQAASEDDKYGKPTDEDKEKQPEAGGGTDGPSGGEAEEPKEEKTSTKTNKAYEKNKIKKRNDHIEIKKTEAELNNTAFKNAAESENVKVKEESVQTTNITKESNFEESSRLNSKVIVDRYNAYVATEYTTREFPPSLYGGQPGDPSYTLQQLINKGMVNEAALLKQNIRKSFNITTGMYDRGSKNFLGFNRRKAIIKQQNSIDDQVYASLLNTKLAENKKEIDYKRRTTLLASIADKTIPIADSISEYIKIHESETGVKDNAAVFRKLYTDLEYLSDKKRIKIDIFSYHPISIIHGGGCCKSSELNSMIYS